MNSFRFGGAWLAMIAFFLSFGVPLIAQNADDSSDRIGSAAGEAEAALDRANALYNRGMELFNGGDFLSAASRFGRPHAPLRRGSMRSPRTRARSARVASIPPSLAAG